MACKDETTKCPSGRTAPRRGSVSTSRIADQDDIGVLAQDRFNPVAKEARLLVVWIWLIVGKTYSTGSSMVMTLSVGLLTSLSVA